MGCNSSAAAPQDNPQDLEVEVRARLIKEFDLQRRADINIIEDLRRRLDEAEAKSPQPVGEVGGRKELLSSRRAETLTQLNSKNRILEQRVRDLETQAKAQSSSSQSTQSPLHGGQSSEWSAKEWVGSLRISKIFESTLIKPVGADATAETTLAKLCSLATTGSRDSILNLLRSGPFLSSLADEVWRGDASGI